MLLIHLEYVKWKLWSVILWPPVKSTDTILPLVMLCTKMNYWPEVAQEEMSLGQFNGNR